jgi:F-type H+-transporting ATPase subunit gamma
MANLKEIRTRIASVTSTRQITSAMKMVSAAKLRKAQDAIIQMRPYAEKLQEILSNVTQSLDHDHDNIYGQQRELKRVLLIPFTSNKGLCGSFNAAVVRRTIDLINNTYSDQYSEGNVDIMAIGKKGYDVLKSKNITVSTRHDELLEKPTFDNALPIIDNVMGQFVDGTYDKVVFIYNRFGNAAVQFLKDEVYLPIEKIEKQEQKFETAIEYIFEPSKKYILEEIIPKSLKIQFFKALLDSNASEHGARMTAMHQATDNATELIKDLQLDYNKARQAAITTELNEIVSGANSLDK